MRLYSDLTPIRPYLYVCLSVCLSVPYLATLPSSIHPLSVLISLLYPSTCLTYCCDNWRPLNFELRSPRPSISLTKIKKETERTKKGLFYVRTERFLNFFFFLTDCRGATKKVFFASIKDDFHFV